MFFEQCIGPRFEARSLVDHAVEEPLSLFFVDKVCLHVIRKLCQGNRDLGRGFTVFKQGPQFSESLMKAFMFMHKRINPVAAFDF